MCFNAILHCSSTQQQCSVFTYRKVPMSPEVLVVSLNEASQEFAIQYVVLLSFSSGMQTGNQNSPLIMLSSIGKKTTHISELKFA